MRRFKQHIIILIVLSLLAVCPYQFAHSQDGDEISDIAGLIDALGGLQGVQYDLTDAPSGGNCALSSFAFGGQGWAISGASGGFTVDNPGGSILPDQIGSNISAMVSQGSEVVAILAVDDFDGPDWSYVDTTVHTLLSADADEALKQTAHGALVEKHFEALMAGSSNPNIRYASVDSGNFDTVTIIAGIREKIGEVYANDSITRFVVNMSFAIVPCVIATDFAASGLLTYEAYVAAIESSNPNLANEAGRFSKDLDEILVSPLDVENDPFASLLQDFCGDSEAEKAQSIDYEEAIDSLCQEADFQIVYVASAGNHAFPYSFYPGAWDEVISVGAIDSTTGLKWAFSNQGEEWAIGAWYTLDVGGVPIYYAGTSFAAPVYSLRLALQMTN